MDIAHTGNRSRDPCRDLAEIHPDKHAEQDDAGALGGSEEAVRFRMMSKTGMIPAAVCVFQGVVTAIGGEGG